MKANFFLLFSGCLAFFLTTLSASANESDKSKASKNPEAEMGGQISLNDLQTQSITQSYEANLSEGLMTQVTSVSQLSDVQPTDWAFQALQSLVERYGCIEGYPDRTYRGNRAITRYEFAAGLNACFNRIQELIAAGSSVTQEELGIIRRLQEEFGAELATLKSRLDALEIRTAQLEANQFSTTTKLNGEAIFALASVFGNKKAGSEEDLEDNIVFADRVRLNFDTSFTGQDLLRTRLQARNITQFSGNVTGTNMTRLGFDGDDGNDIILDDLYYRFPIGSKINVFLAGANTEFYDIADVFNPLLANSGTGAISRFGRFNPIYWLGNEAAGAGLTVEFNRVFGFNAAYLASHANNPTNKNGLFNGTFGALAQLTVRPNNNIDLGLTYVHSYITGSDIANSNITVSGGVGSSFAEQPFGNAATSADAFGAELNLRINRHFALGGWVGWMSATAEDDGYDGIFRIAKQGDNANIFNWAVTLAFPNIGKEGNLAGFVIGMPPKVVDNDASDLEDKDTSLHLEAFYRWQVSDNIGITPGLIVITNPEHNSNNDTIFVGTIRTTFSF